MCLGARRPLGSNEWGGRRWDDIVLVSSPRVDRTKWIREVGKRSHSKLDPGSLVFWVASMGDFGI